MLSSCPPLLQRVVTRVRSAVAGLDGRTPPLPAPVRGWLNRRMLSAYLRGDPAARGEHLRVAGTLGGAALIGAILLGATGIIVSPVVWETVLLAWFVLSFALVAGNGYWRGGLAAGYALVFAPVIGGAAGAVTVGTFTGYGFTQVTAVLFGVVLVPLTGGVGHSGRKAREAWL